MSKKNLPHFRTLQLRGGDIRINGVSIQQPLQDFRDQTNQFVDDVNTTNKQLNLAQAVGYFVGFVVALISFYLTVDC